MPAPARSAAYNALMDDSANTVQTLFDAANQQLAKGAPDAAERLLRQALALAPDEAALHANLALTLAARAAVGEAETAFRTALALAPATVQIRINFGNFLHQQKRFTEAEALYRESLRRFPAAPGLWSNLGMLLTCLHRETEAEHCLRTALSLVPDHANAGFNLAYLLLRQGRYEEGWAYFERRDWYARLGQALGLPRWQGEPLAGKAILIGIEAGHGDMIQFCRYAAQLKEAGAARVSLICHPALKTLLAGQCGIDDALALDDPAPDGMHWHYWVPAMSLPYLFATRLDTVPAALPYLHADPQRMATWAPCLDQDGLKVGLVWRGSAKFENDDQRSLPSLQLLEPLAKVPGIHFVSLQKGPGEDELRRVDLPFPLHDLGGRVADFADTAAIIAQLDLVISVDTAVAHLAGALGRPIWLLLPDYKTDWRWLAERTDSPWYPGVMRLFRQPRGGNWRPVVAAVHDALLEWEMARRRPGLHERSC